MKRKIKKNKICKLGHLIAGNNLRVNSKGYQICKKCHNENIYKWTKLHKEEFKNYFKKYQAERVRNGEALKSVLKWNKKNPEKKLAHMQVRKAVRLGELIKKSCHVCGEKKVDGHHPDYTKPLEVIWLCRQHHKQLHAGTLSIN